MENDVTNWAQRDNWAKVGDAEPQSDHGILPTHCQTIGKWLIALADKPAYLKLQGTNQADKKEYF